MARFWTLTSTLLIMPTALTFAQTAPVTIPGTQRFDLRAKGSGREFRVSVALPEGYTDRDTTRYATLYVLDGNDAFPLAVETQRYLQVQREVPAIIVVGVGYPVDYYSETLVPRYFDLTPSADRRADSTFAPAVAQARPGHKIEPLHSGGGPAFLATLTGDVIPFIEGRYRTSGDRGLWGHSFGAAFAMYTLFTAPESFARYALCSPSLWWNGGDLYALETKFATSHQRFPARVFLSVGGNEGKEMVSGVDSLARLLQRRQYEGFELTTVTFDGETHMSSVPAAMSRSLRTLYDSNSRR